MRTMPKMLALLLILALVGCRAGPDDETLEADLQKALDTDFQADLLEVSDYARKGVYPYVAEGDDRERLLVYYDADLVFKTDHTLTGWEKLGVGSLLGVLGAKPLGIHGLKEEGNVAGDVLSVYGATSYVAEGGGWTRVAEAAPEVKGAANVTRTEDIDHKLDLTARQRQLKRLESVGAKVERSKDENRITSFDAELERFVSLSECRLAAREGRPTVATGLPFGEYARFGYALAAILNANGKDTCVLPTDGSVENVDRVIAGDVAFGVVQGDVAAMASKGRGLFSGRVPATKLRAVCSLFPEAVQVVVKTGGGVTSAADLKGRRVGLGPLGSGSRASARRVLRGLGIPPSDLKQIDSRPTGLALKALAAGELDAVFVTGTWPLGVVSQLAAAGEVAFAPLPSDVVKKMAATDPSLVPMTLPINTYPGQSAPYTTVAVTATLVTSEDADDKLVTSVLESLMGNVKTLAGQTSHAWYVSRGTAQTGRSIPLHPAAQRYLAPSK